MPPRRSSRSTRASIEPTAVETLPAKRKRGPAPEADVEEKENIVKPASKAKRSVSARSNAAPSSKSRVSLRNKQSLPDVAESEDEEDGDSPPPVKKKARPSIDAEEQDDEKPDVSIFAEYESDSKSRVKRMATGRRGVVPKVEEGAVVVNGRTRGGASKQINVSTRSGSSMVPPSRKGRGSRVVKTESPADEGEEEEEVKPHVSKGRKSVNDYETSHISQEESKHGADASDDDDDDDDDDEVPIPARKGRKAKAPTPARKPRITGKKKVKRITVDSEEESDVESIPPPTPAQRPMQRDDKEDNVNDGVTPIVEEEEEEERSLFDPLPIPAASTLPQTMPKEPAGPKSRLVIHKLALINFKSYAGRQEIGPFHKSFSSIVGPNGSGKSNTIDALLFVFGYRASKMRQAKVSELIHNSAMYPDLNECSVEIHFREIIDHPGPDTYKIVPGSQLVVARQAFKNNSSVYMINRRPSSYTEVQTLLKGRGIDLDHKRFLILQGEVESIAQMKPKAPSEHEDGLLEYLEDIIGTSKYKEPIDEALVDMERLQEERGVKMNRLRLVEKEKSALENKKREAEDYLRLRNEHVKAQSRLWQFLLFQCLTVDEKLTNNIHKIQAGLAEETERNKDDISHLDLLKTHYEERQKAYAEIQAAAAAATKDLAANEKQEVGLQERLKHAKGKEKKLKKTLQDDTAAKNKTLRDIEDSRSKIKREKSALEQHEASLVKEEKVLEGIRDSLKDKTQVFHDQIEVKQKELQPWTAKINTRMAEIDVATSERDALAKKAEAILAASQESQQTLELLQRDQQGKFKEQNRLKGEKASRLKQIQVATKNIEDLKGKVSEWRSKDSSSRQKVDEAKASQSENRSQNRVLDSLMRLKDQGRVQGFHGRLGSLGTIPDKYDVAITTACSSLNHMVVDKVEQGQACIEYLRSQNVGRASFLVLEKLQGNNGGMQKMQTPENVPRLFELIKPKDPRFAPAFYKAIGNTLVADDMEQANRIAYGAKRWRVVTLAGQMIETSGAMSGGGSQPARGGMSSKLAADTVRPEVLREYEKEHELASQKLQQALEQLRTAEAELDQLNKSGPELDLSYEKLGLDIEQGKRRILEAEKRVKDLKSQSKPNTGDLTRIQTLEKEITASTAELESLQNKSSKIESAIKDLEKKILDIGGSKLLAQKSTVDGIKLHITLANDEITKAEVVLAKAEKDSIKLDTSIETNQAAIAEVEAEREELTSQLGDLQQYVSELRSKMEAAQTAAENSKDDLENLKAELDEKEEQISGFRQKEMELKQALTDYQKELANNNRAIQHWETEHSKLRLEEVDGDDDEDEDESVEPKEEGENPNDPDREQDDEPMKAVKAENDEQPATKNSSKKRANAKETSNELYEYSHQELIKFKKPELVADAELLDERIKNLKPDLSVLREYRKREEEFLSRAKDLEAVTALRDAQKQKYDELRKQRLDEFMAGFNLISLKLKEMYQMITLGGNAELELVDSLDPFSEGIIFSVMPPKKSWKNISNLSGGEKTLSSLALVFALHVFKPTPLYFMDEIDAALDFRNVSIVANYIKDRTKNAQFIIISLRNDMFELSHRLIGIYKTSNATRSISIDNHALTAVTPPLNAIA